MRTCCVVYLYIVVVFVYMHAFLWGGQVYVLLRGD